MHAPKLLITAFLACSILTANAQAPNRRHTTQNVNGQTATQNANGQNPATPTKPQPVMTKVDKNTYTVNTTTLSDARGFKGTTPLLVTFTKKSIKSVEALPNTETPRFFQRIITELLPKFTDLDISKTADVDCITGATMSSRAVKANIEAAKKYYQDNKK